jgi:hypothetical protein
MSKEAIERRIDFVKSIDFADPKFDAEFDRIEKENKVLLDSTRVNVERLNLRFTV